MNFEMISGILIIVLAYLTTWLLLLKSVNIINFIHAHDLKNIKEIQDRLHLKRRGKD